MAVTWISADHPAEFITPYDHILVFDQMQKKEPIRVYLQSGAYGSASFLSEGKRNEIVFPYLKVFDRALSLSAGPDLLLIGGAGYQFPKYVLSHYPDRTIDVVEIDPDSLKIAKRYFFLDACLAAYDTGEIPRFHAYCDDGRAFMQSLRKKGGKSYDVIFNDAFGSCFPAPYLATAEAARTAQSLLTPGGLYVANTLGSASGPKSRFLKAEYRTLSEVFPHVYVVETPRDGLRRRRYNNFILFASDRPLPIQDAMALSVTDADPVLRDAEDPGRKVTEMVMH